MSDFPLPPVSDIDLPPEINQLLRDQLKSLDFAFTVSDPTKPDNPICYASQRFYDLTGYTSEEVIGKNCRFLQGPETEKRKVMEIRDAVREDRSCQVLLLNYKKCGERFWNQFYLAPLRDEEGRVSHYIGIQSDVTHEVESNAAFCPEKGMQPSSMQSAVAVSELVPEVAEVVDEEASEAEAVKHILEEGHCHSSSHLHSSLLQPLMQVQQSFVLADPSLPDTPIVHASEQFLKLTGYPRSEVIGHNCRFLQGPGTDPAELQRLRDAIKADPPRPVTVTLLNYRYDGTPFWNALHVAPVRDAKGRVSFFVGVQLDITQPAEQEEDGTAPRKVAADPSVAAGASWCAAAAAGAQGPAQEASCKAGRVGLVHKTAHMSATGAIRVAVRSLGGEQGLRRSLAHQGLPRSTSSPLASRQGSAKSIGSLSSKSLPVTGAKAGEGVQDL